MDVLWMWLALASLATFRVSEMIVREDGPFGIFQRVRIWTGMSDYDIDGNPYKGANQFQVLIGGITSCVYCAGIWVSALATLLFFTNYGTQLPLPFYVVFWVATAGSQYAMSLLNQRIRGELK